MLGWWRNWRQQAAANKATLAINDNVEVRASQVPELIGLSQIEAMAYILEQIKLWNESCTPLQSTELASRLIASGESWKQQGLTMPYWGNLWVLRTYQAELGLDVPAVAPSAKA